MITTNSKYWHTVMLLILFCVSSCQTKEAGVRIEYARFYYDSIGDTFLLYVDRFLILSDELDFEGGFRRRFKDSIQGIKGKMKKREYDILVSYFADSVTTNKKPGEFNDHDFDYYISISSSSNSQTIVFSKREMGEKVLRAVEVIDSLIENGEMSLNSSSVSKIESSILGIDSTVFPRQIPPKVLMRDSF